MAHRALPMGKQQVKFVQQEKVQVDLKCHFRPHFMFIRGWATDRCVVWKAHRRTRGALWSRPHWRQTSAYGHLVWAPKMRQWAWVTSRVPCGFQIWWLKTIYYISHKAEKKNDLLFTVYSNTNSNEFTKNYQVLFCFVFAFTHVASLLCTSKNYYLLS